MNCDEDFNIPYQNTYVKVKPFCESNDVHFKVYLQEHEVKLNKVCDENGQHHWTEYNKGETQLARSLGNLIEEYEKQQ
jgi:hypothetical protein